MSEQEDFVFNNLAGMVRLRVPRSRDDLPKGVRWIEYVISTECAKRLRDELDAALKQTDYPL
jgi:hypothetical protein